MTVHFIGAGPGAPDLITVRGRDLIARCPSASMPARWFRALCSIIVRRARGSSTPRRSISMRSSRSASKRPRGPRTSRGSIRATSRSSARWASSCGGSNAAGVAYTITPGVPAFAAAAAALERELTLPGLAQSLVLTRTSGRASPMPERETLADFAATGATLAIHLSIHALERVVAELTPFYGPDCPAAVVARASWPDERIVRATLREIAGALRETPIERTALILVGPGAWGARFSRKRALQRGLCAPVSRRAERGRMTCSAGPRDKVRARAPGAALALSIIRA